MLQYFQLEIMSIFFTESCLVIWKKIDNSSCEFRIYLSLKQIYSYNVCDKHSLFVVCMQNVDWQIFVYLHDVRDNNDVTVAMILV